MASPILAIGFDLDGTLVDSLDLSARWMTRAATLALGQPVSEALVRSHFGKPEQEIFAAFLKEDTAAVAFSHYQKLLAADTHQIKLYAQVKEVLDFLKSTPLALFTSRGTWATEQILREHGLAGYFRVVLAGDQVNKVKPDPEGLLKICAQLSVAPESLLYVGDSPADVQAAEAAGARGYQALWAKGTAPFGALHLKSMEEIKSLLVR